MEITMKTHQSLYGRDSHTMSKAARVGWVKRSATHQSLPINPGILLVHIAPLAGIRAELYIAMERGIRPIRGAAHMPVPDRVEVDVVHVSLPIGLIAQGVFPEATLPDAALAFPGSTLRSALCLR
jgi:hypothetical protein